MRISDWSSDVCSSDLLQSGSGGLDPINAVRKAAGLDRLRILPADSTTGQGTSVAAGKYITRKTYVELITDGQGYSATRVEFQITRWLSLLSSISTMGRQRSEEHTSELQSLMRNSYAVFCLKQKIITSTHNIQQLVPIITTI